MFNSFLISFVIVPLLVGVAAAARGRDAKRGRSALLIGWVVYAVLWFSALYYLRDRWA